jgi:transcriptional regulator with XRE-family HTH domain
VEKEQRRKVGDYIRQLRVARGLTQLQLATALGTTPGTVSKWESGAREPQRNLSAISSFFGVTSDAILSAGVETGEGGEPAVNTDQLRRFLSNEQLAHLSEPQKRHLVALLQDVKTPPERIRVALELMFPPPGA